MKKLPLMRQKLFYKETDKPPYVLTSENTNISTSSVFLACCWKLSLEASWNTSLMHLSNGVTPLSSAASWGMHTHATWRCLLTTHTRTHTRKHFILRPPWAVARLCTMWESVVRHLEWECRRQMRGTKLAVAPVPGVAGPWVRWAILIEGRERTGLQLPQCTNHFADPTSCLIATVGW